MSSHHIVRDEQEPALLLWETEQLSHEQVGQLLEWSPRVVVHQQALSEALNWGIKLDAVCAAPEQIAELSQLLAHQQPVTILALPGEDALQWIFRWLESKNQQSLNLLANAREQEYALLQQITALSGQLQVQVFSQDWRYSYFKAGKSQKWLPAESQLRLIAFQGKPMITANAVFSINEAQPGVQEVYLQQPGLLTISSAAPFWLGEKL